jgi:hypothetical protein
LHFHELQCVKIPDTKRFTPLFFILNAGTWQA